MIIITFEEVNNGAILPTCDAVICDGNNYYCLFEGESVEDARKAGAAV